MQSLTTLPATQLAALIRSREVSPVEVVDAHIRRIEAVNPVINAVVAERYEAACAEAAAAERRLAAGGEPPPLLGVPFTVKEMVSLEGMPHTLGSLARVGRRADADAEVVRRLRAAGAIPLGVTNLPEWAVWFETHNRVYGRTSNPYDTSRTPGGSSGGEAATVAAGGSPFGVGSDIGGSIRIPAAFCGVFGHKPTTGLLPLTGHLPVYATGPDAELPRHNPWVTLGPIARSARDLMPLLKIMAGPDGVDPNAGAIPLGDPASVEWKGRRVLVLDDPRITLAAAAKPEVRQAVWSAARALEGLGAEIELLPSDFFRAGTELWFAALRSTTPPTLRQLMSRDEPVSVPRELLRRLTGRPRITWALVMFLLGERLAGLSGRRMRALVAQGERLGERLAEKLGEGGVLLMPPHPRPAPHHDVPLLHPFDYAYTAVLNVLRVPATVAPVGFNAHGLPLAVQIVARRGADHLTIAAAEVVESLLGGWRPPATVRDPEPAGAAAR